MQMQRHFGRHFRSAYTYLLRIKILENQEERTAETLMLLLLGHIKIIPT
jgi:hypothetical protein